VNQPNPWILFSGGIALLNVAFIVWSARAPEAVRYGGAVLVAAAGLGCIVLGLTRGFQKKPERTKFQSKRKPREVTLDPPPPPPPAAA
jgi:hypothetical protein